MSQPPHLTTESLVDLFMQIQYVTYPTCSIEIGAYEATFSKKMVQSYPNIPVWAFEANPYNYEKFSAECLSLGIKYMHMAIANKVGSIDFMLQHRYTDDGTLLPKDLGNNSILYRSKEGLQYAPVSVKCSTLDTYFKETLSNDERVVLWIDVEGASEAVLTNAISTLEKTNSIFIEVEHYGFWNNQWLFPQVDEFLRENDFYLVARDSEYDGQNNCIYVKRNSGFPLCGTSRLGI